MNSASNKRISQESIETVAGLSAGLVSTLVVHPLDIIKTRLQVNTTANPLLNSSRAVLKDILHNEGPTRIGALYRGLGVNLIGNSAGWALFFLWYQQAQDLMRQWKGYDQTQQLSSLEYLGASFGAGSLSAVLTNPIWVVKTRILSTSATQAGAYGGMISGLASIYSKEGLRGFFHGLIPSLAGVSHGALYFLAYEKMKLWRRQRRPGEQLSNIDTLLASSASKVFAGTLTYPHQVVRARLQTFDPALIGQQQNPGVMGVIRNLWHKQGFVGFYKGLFPNLLRVVPSTCVTFLVYENVRWALPQMLGDVTPAAHDSARPAPDGHRLNSSEQPESG